MTQSTPKKRFALVGLGRVAEVHHAALLKQSDRAELIAVCDVREDACAAWRSTCEVSAYTDLDQMLQHETLDAAVVMLPHNLHRNVVERLLDAGVAILLEKPLASRLEDAQAITERAEQSDLPVLVGHNGLFHPAYDRLLRIVQGGWIGKPLSASARSLQWLDFKPWDFRLSKAATGGGAWVDCAGHLLYRLEGVFGEPVEITGFASSHARPEMEGEDTAAAVVRYASGSTAQVMVSYGCKLPGYEHDWPHGCEQMLFISGSRGAVEYRICPQSTIRLFSEVPGVMPDLGGGWLNVDVPEDFEVSFERQMAHFVDCLHGQAKPKVPPAKALSLLTRLHEFYR